MNKPVTTAEIVRIGNSKGLRIPKAIRDQIGLEGQVTLAVEGNALVVRKSKVPRAGWRERCARALRKNPEQELLLPDDVGTEYDKDWVW
jgi:antitoxin MazE